MRFFFFIVGEVTMIAGDCFTEEEFSQSVYHKALQLIKKGDKPVSLVIDEQTSISYIHTAAWWNDDELLQHMLQYNLKIDYLDAKGRTPLMTAAQKGHTALFEKLLKQGANVNHQSNTGVTALAFAIHFKHKVILERCIEYGANLNFTDFEGNTLLHKACKEGGLSEVTTIEQHGVDVNYKNNAGLTPLIISCQRGHLDVVRYLVISGSDIQAKSNEHMNAFEYAFVSDCEEVVEYMRGKSKELSNEKGTDLISACQAQNSQLLTSLLLQGANPNFKDPNHNWVSPLHVAVIARNLDMVKILLYYGGNINEKDVHNRTPLFEACFMGNEMITSFLIEAGANLNIRDAKEHSALMCACQCGSIEIVKMLLHNGALQSFKDKTGLSALGHATRNGHKHIVTLFLETGQVNVNICDVAGKTGLSVAADNSDFEMLDIFLGWGADINCQDINLSTPLMVAIIKNNYPIVQYLIEHGARTDICNIIGANAFQLAQFRGNVDIITYLEAKSSTRLHFPQEIPDRTRLLQLCESYTDISSNPSGTAQDNLFDMCKNGWLHPDLLTYVLDNGADINCKTRNGFSPILLVCANNHLSHIETLLQHGSQINGQDPEGYSPLMYAVKHNNLMIVDLLLRNGADVNLQEKHGKTALMLALETQRTDIAESLLGKEGVDILCKDMNGETTISYCKRYNAGEDILHMIIENEKQCLNCSRSCSEIIHCPSENHESQFLEACAESNIAEIQMLVQHYKEYSMETMEKCLTVLTLNSDLDTLKWFRSIGIDILIEFGNGENILFVAVKMKYFSLVESLLQMNQKNAAHFSEGGCTPAMVAIDTDDPDLDIVFYLVALERKVHFGVGNCKSVLRALQKGIYEIFHYNHELRSYDKTCKDCINANQTEYVLL